MIEYRKAVAGDIAVLADMRVLMLFDGANQDEALKEKIRSNTFGYIKAGFTDKSFLAWIAVQNGKIVSMSGLTFFTLPPNDWCPNGKTAYIGNMYTLPEYRGQGIASHLLSLAVEEAKGNGCERILLNTTDMGRPMYESFGFEDSPTAMAYYPELKNRI